MLALCACVLAVTCWSAQGLDAEKWKSLHEKMLKKAAADKQKKEAQATAATTTGAGTGVHAGAGTLIDVIPIRLDDGKFVNDIDLEIYSSPDAITQAKRFCNEHFLSKEYCEAVTQRAVEVFNAGVRPAPTSTQQAEPKPSAPPASQHDMTNPSVAAKLADIINRRRGAAESVPVSSSFLSEGPSELVDVIPINIQDVKETISVDFKLFSNMDPESQVRDFCVKYDLMVDHCEALRLRTLESFSSFMQRKKRPQDPEPAPTIQETKNDPVLKSSVAAKLADILSKRRKSSRSPTPVTATASDMKQSLSSPTATSTDSRSLIDTVQVQIQGEGEALLVNFELFADTDPLKQAHDFCRKYDLLADYCRALSDRAVSLFTEHNKPDTVSVVNPDTVEPERKSSVASKLADILNKRRKSSSTQAAVGTHLPRDASATVNAELLDTVPIQMEDGAETYRVDFKLYSEPDAQSQARAFCIEYKLNENYCEALTNRANTVYSDALKRKSSSSTPSQRRLVERIPVRLEYENNIVDAEFNLYNSPDPLIQAKSFCKEYDLSDVYCEALTQRAVDVFNAAASPRNGEQSQSDSSASTKSDSRSSVAAKLADILKKRRQSNAKVPDTASAPSIIDIIPIRMEYEDEIVDIEFKIIDNSDPRQQAKAFCREHDLVPEYCEALIARAEFLYSNR